MEMNEQNKSEVQISKNVTKIANFWSKIGQDATFATTLNVHNSAIFYPSLTFNTPKWRARQDKSKAVKC